MEQPEKKNEDLQLRRDPPRKKRGLAVLLVLATGLLLSVLAFWVICIRQPGTSFVPSEAPAKVLAETQSNSPASGEGSGADESTRGIEPTADAVPEPAGDSSEAPALTLSKELEAHVVHLAETIGERNLEFPNRLNKAADYVESQLASYGYDMERQTFQCRELDCHNIIAEVVGTKSPEKIVIIGAHYDSAQGTPGANDNGSGTSAMLALARHFQKAAPRLTLRFVGFTNEEPPYFQNKGEMGSWVYAEACRKNNDDILGVISLETMGYFTDEPDSQKYPTPLDKFYPSTGNFIGFVANLGSRPLQRKAIKIFREHAEVPSEGASLPDILPGIGWSDHWSFWQEGYQGIMVSDTAVFRYPHYHEPTDTPDKIDFERFAKTVEGLKFVVADLAGIDANSPPVEE